MKNDDKIMKNVHNPHLKIIMQEAILQNKIKITYVSISF
jgi:hypothetical protein